MSPFFRVVRRFLLSGGVAFACLSTLLLRPADAQVVQLPTFTSFSIGTTVQVPDRGAVYLGGIRRAREGSVSRGALLPNLLPNGGIGREIGRQDASVHATIIDLREWDEAVLAEAAHRRQVEQASLTPAARKQQADRAATERKAAWIARHLGRGKR